MWSLETVQIRDFATDKHRTVDDTPAGGGAGMVLRADVLAAAIDHALARHPDCPILAMTPRGAPLTQARVRELAGGPGRHHLVRPVRGFRRADFRGRGRSSRSRSATIVLSGGEPAALACSMLAFGCFPA